MDVTNIIKQFRLLGKTSQTIPFGNGHINDTYRVINQEPGMPDYLLQRINHNVFPHVPELMLNIWHVTEHIKQKVGDNPELYSGFETLTIVSSTENKLFFEDPSGNYWRVFHFFPDFQSYDITPSEDQVYEGAKAFGRFLKILSDLPANLIHPSIPQFHDVIFRIQNFKLALETASVERKQKSADLIEFVLQHATEMSAIELMGKAGKIPLRITHNDCKFNNVLLDQQNKGRCVIDLDTVMPGYVHYDFGDGIRTTASTAVEDEPDLDKVMVDISKFNAFSQGYLEVVGDILNTTEKAYLSLSGPLFSYIMGVRFLTDFLSGDVYYKIKHPEHNFQRARCQLHLTGLFLERLPELSATIYKNL